MEDAAWFVRALFEARSQGTQGQAGTTPVQRTLFGWATSAMNKILLNEKNGWIVPLNLGRYDIHYALRAIVSLVGLGANGPDDAVLDGRWLPPAVQKRD